MSLGRECELFPKIPLDPLAINNGHSLKVAAKARLRAQIFL